MDGEKFFYLQIYFERYPIFYLRGNRRNLKDEIYCLYSLTSKVSLCLLSLCCEEMLWRDVVKNEKAMGAILFHPWDPLCGAWGAEKEVRSSLQTLSRLFSFFGGLENITRIANAVQVTLRQSDTNPQRHDYNFSNCQELWTVYMWNCLNFLSHFGPKKFDWVGRGGQGRSKYGPEWASLMYIFGCGAL